VANDHWQTPRPLFDELDREFGFQLDAAASESNALCASYLTEEDDALQLSWRELAERVWINPPYSRGNLPAFLEKAVKEAQHGCTVVALVPADTSTKWWHEFAMQAAEIRFLRPRVRHRLNGKAQGSPKFGSAVLVFSEERRLPRFRSMEVPK